MNEEGQEWQNSSGIAFWWDERLCTKWTRSVWTMSGCCGDGILMVVRNWGSELLRRASSARQS